MSKTEIIPAILPKDYAELEEKILLVKGLVKNIQIDVCDGQFVQNASWPYRKHDDSFAKIATEELGLPGWEEENFEIDLMANRPEELVDEWVSAGAARIIIHVEAKGDIAAAIQKLADRAEIGLAINIDTPLEALEPFVGSSAGPFKDKVQFIQCMGIDQIGYQHQPFDAKVIEKIKAVKARFPGLKVSVDGGVSLETAPRLIEAGADRLVVGSAIFNDENPIDAVMQFKRL
jgi:ribulose-phosphate 3-epimerase